MDEVKTTLDDPPSKPKLHPHQRANFFSRLFFCWALPFFIKGYKKELTEADLYGALKAHESSTLGKKLETVWLKEKETHTKPQLWRSLTKVYGLEILLYGFVILFQELIVRMANPLLIGRLMAYYNPEQTHITIKEAYFYAGSIIGLSVLNTIISHSYNFGMSHIGMKIRVGLCSLIYRKALKLSKCALGDTTLGQMVNLMSNDVNRFDMLVPHLHFMVVAPIEAFVVLYLLYRSVHPAALAGTALLLAFVPLQMYLGKRTSFYRFRTAVKTDQRVRLMNEIITGIQVIKMYTWEKPFTKLVELARKSEIHQIKGVSYIRAFNLSVGLFLNRCSIYICIITYVLTGNVLTAEYVYVLTSFYSLLRQSLTMFLPRAITVLAESNVSIKRLEKFLSYDEINDDTGNPSKNKEKFEVFPLENSVKIQIGIAMKEVSVKWNESSKEDTLKNINFKAEPGQLIGVVGPVGSGKTTLLHIILKEIPVKTGHLEVSGRISYAAQEPWLFAASIRQNILFGNKLEAERYQRVIRACSLERDLSLLPFGDRTVVGERGVMLSGGQKARINLARAIYKDADIYLLDDPLSAVDAHVGKELFENCISGFLKDKCTILVTHQLQYLGNVDKIYLLEEGTISASGTYSELQNSGGEFVKLLENVTQETQKEEEKVNKTEAPKFKSLTSLAKGDKPVEVKETRSSGKLSKRLYRKYFEATGSYLVCFLLMIAFILAQIAGSANDLFITFWVNLEQERKMNALNLTNASEDSWKFTFFTRDNCIFVHTFIMVFMIVISLTRSLGFFRTALKASQTLHNRMFENIVRATMRFFNTNPSGRILNRFSKDMGSLDEILPQTVTDTIQTALTVFGITMVLSSVNPWILIPTVVVFSIFYGYKVVFIATSRDLKRMEGITRSPVFSHLSASLQGLSTIRAFSAQKAVQAEFDNHQNLHSSTFFMFLGCSRTFGFWLDISCNIYIGLVILSFLVMGSEMFGGNVGLALTQSTSMTMMLQMGMRQWSELENQMTAVERVIEYTEIEREKDKSKEPPRSWPDFGKIDFSSVFMSYSPDTPIVLRNLTFSIKHKEKIGVVGRTGAGKSSLIQALFQLAPVDGNITIDGVDISQISLQSLRSKVSIIPQEPVLFSGTLRKNLDPFDEYQDEQLWKVLEEVKLKTVVADLPSDLHSNVAEGGSNFSVGQRQLLCLARAILKSNKILILDEATANVDPQTDELIQNTIRSEFEDCTVLTIAHRLHTIMDSDRILVMSAGQMVEFDHPYVLLQNTDGVFYGLVQQTGTGMVEHLMKIATESYQKRNAVA